MYRSLALLAMSAGCGLAQNVGAESTTPQQFNGPSVRVTSCGFYGKPRSTSQRAVRLDRWVNEGDAKSRSMMDVVCEIRNHGASASDFMVLTFMDFIVAPTSQYGLDLLEDMKTSVSWGQVTLMDDVRMVNVPWLKPGETRRVRISGFDILPLLKHYDGESDTLWPWWMRVNVRVEDRTGQRLTNADAAIPLIPSEKRLKQRVGTPIDRHEPIQPLSPSTGSQTNALEKSTPAITGTAVDRSGAVIVNAKVDLSNEGGSLLRSNRTDVEGGFHFEPADVGVYRISISADGFRTKNLNSVRIGSGVRVSLGRIELESLNIITDPLHP